MLEQFSNQLSELALLRDTRPVLVAVSGGLDSMTLLHLLHQCGIRLGVAHANFQLRGEESLGDEQLVQAVCARMQVPFYLRRFDTTQVAMERGISIQMAARDLRYAWFQEVAQQEGFGVIATAHQADDHAETIILNLLRGGTNGALRGIPVRNGLIIRPLLKFTREQILTYAQSAGLEWREDSSNRLSDYDRNFLRNQVIPRIAAIKPAYRSALESAQKWSAEAATLVESIARQEKAKWEPTPWGWRISMANYQFPGARLVLVHSLAPYGFHPDQISNALMNFRTGARLESPNFELFIDRGEWALAPKVTESSPVTIPEAGVFTLGKAKLQVQVTERTAEMPAPNSLIAQLNADLITFPLIWRQWVTGDVFQPLGMKGRKKLSDFMVDEKYAGPEKRLQTVVCSGEEILWVVGKRIADPVKITPQTRKVLELKLLFTGINHPPGDLPIGDV